MKIFFRLREVFPLPLLQGSTSYVNEHTAKANFQAISALESAATKSSPDNIKELLAHSLRYIGDEQDRGASIMSRGQALLIAQTFFGALLAFITAIIGRAEIFSGYFLAALTALLAFTLILVVLLTVNALRATQLIAYRKMGTTDLLKWIETPAGTFSKCLALETLVNYRQASIVNSWRATHLAYAQMCLRNIVFALAMLVVVVFAAIVLAQGSKGSASNINPAPPLNWIWPPPP